MNSILIPESLLHEKDYNAKKYFSERFPSDYSTMESNPNYSESGCGIAVTADATEKTLSIKDPNDDTKELCKLTYSDSGLKFTYKKPAMVNNITMVGVGSDEKLNILEDNFDILHLNVVKKMGGVYDITITNNLRGIDYGNGKLAIAGASCAGWSTDGTDLTISSSTISGTMYSVCYGNGTFVAVGNTATAYYSTDGGATWTSTTMPTASANGWTKVTYGNGKFVTVSNNTNVAAYSTDGITWTAATMPKSGLWQAMTYGNGKFVCFNVDKGITAYSTDGINWTEGEIENIAVWRMCCYGNDRFVVIGFSNNKFAYSTDGITWTTGDMISNPTSVNYMWSNITYGNGKFVVVSQTKGTIAYSYNGYQWYIIDSETSHSMNSICYYPDKDYFVTVGGKEMRIISISDAYVGGVCSTFAVEYDWYGSIPDGVTLPNPTSYASGASVTVDTTYTSDSVVDGVDFTNWSDGGSIPTSTSTSFSKGCYGNGTYVLLNSITANPHVYYSTDAITWNKASLPANTYWTAICYGGGKFVAIGSTNGSVASYGKVGAYSSDGIIWTQMELPSHYWRDICYGNGLFVAIAYNDSNYIAYSTDGINWTEKSLSSLGAHSSVNAIFYGNGKFVIIESRQYIYYSSDGINWTLGNIGADSTNSRALSSGCYGNGKYVLTGDQSNGSNNVFYSTDLVNWTGIHATNTGRFCGKIIFTGLYFIALCGTTFGSTIEYNMIMYSIDGIEWNTIKANTINSNINYGYALIYGNSKIIYSGKPTSSNQTQYISSLTLPDSYYSFSGWNKSGTFNITSDTTITGSWSKKSKLSVTYSWTNAPSGMTSTVPAKITGLMPNETVAVDSTYTNKSAYKDTTNKKYYKFSGWNKSGSFNITSNTTISGSWDNGTDPTINWTVTTITGEEQFSKVVFGDCNNGIFVVMVPTYAGGTDGSNNCRWSKDGITWTSAKVSASNHYWVDIAYGDGYFVMIAKDGQITYSSDGVIWSEYNIGTTGHTNIVYNENRLLFATLSSSAVSMVDTSDLTTNSWSKTNLKYQTTNTLIGAVGDYFIIPDPVASQYYYNNGNDNNGWSYTAYNYISGFNSIDRCYNYYSEYYNSDYLEFRSAYPYNTSSSVNSFNVYINNNSLVCKSTQTSVIYCNKDYYEYNDSSISTNRLHVLKRLASSYNSVGKMSATGGFSYNGNIEKIKYNDNYSNIYFEYIAAGNNIGICTGATDPNKDNRYLFASIGTYPDLNYVN